MPMEMVLQVEPFSSIAFFSTKKVNPEKPWSEYKPVLNCEFNIKQST
jgi:hypothetical protein